MVPSSPVAVGLLSWLMPALLRKPASGSLPFAGMVAVGVAVGPPGVEVAVGVFVGPPPESSP